MINYKYISDNVVVRIEEDGSIKLSCSTQDPTYLEWLSEGNTTLPADNPVLTIKDYQDAVQNILDEKARERSYDGILSLCSYASSFNPTFAAEAQAGLAWRDNAWSTCYTLLAQWQTGQIQQPTIEEVLAALPAMNW